MLFFQVIDFDFFYGSLFQTKIIPSPISYQSFSCRFVHLRQPDFRSFNWKQKRTDIKAGNLLCQSGLLFLLESLRQASILLFWIFLFEFSSFLFSFLFLFLYACHCLVYSAKPFSRKLQETKTFDL